jgi:hypothetical protein
LVLVELVLALVYPLVLVLVLVLALVLVLDKLLYHISNIYYLYNRSHLGTRRLSRKGGLHILVDICRCRSNQPQSMFLTCTLVHLVRSMLMLRLHLLFGQVAYRGHCLFPCSLL